MSKEVDSLVIEVRRLAREYPDAVYGTGDACYYTKGEVDLGPPGVEGCIMGQALRNLDVNMQDLLYGPEDGAYIDEILERLDWLDDTDDETLVWLRAVQKAQDLAARWEFAVNEADRKVDGAYNV